MSTLSLDAQAWEQDRAESSLDYAVGIDLDRRVKAWQQACDAELTMQRVSDDELTQLLADQAVLLLAIRRGYLTADEAAVLQLSI